MISIQNMVLGAPPTTPNGSAPRCEHLDELAPVAPQAKRCQECRIDDDPVMTLVVCLTCGWVACAANSPNRHANDHYAETDHPLVSGLEPGSHWIWCYVHERLV